MTTRLRDLDDELGAAFRSADRDAPRPEAKAALMAALGVGAVAAASTASAAAAAGAATTAAAGGSTAAAAKGVGLAVIAKWVLASAVIVGGTAATVHAVSQPDPPAVVAASPARPTVAVNGSRGATPPQPALAPGEASPREPAATAAIAAAAVAPTPTAAATAPPAPARVGPAAPGLTGAGVTPAPAGAPPAAAAPVAAAPVAPAPAAAPPAAVADDPAPRRATVGDEIAALDRARSQLASGNGAGALEALRDYRRSFPAGVLAQEASVLEIESLAAAGQGDRARTLGGRFVAEHPRSPLIPRVQRAMGK
jgi:hypothetical protein